MQAEYWVLHSFVGLPHRRYDYNNILLFYCSIGSLCTATKPAQSKVVQDPLQIFQEAHCIGDEEVH